MGELKQAFENSTKDIYSRIDGHGQRITALEEYQIREEERAKMLNQVQQRTLSARQFYMGLAGLCVSIIIALTSILAVTGTLH